jgi:hypothetical protein
METRNGIARLVLDGYGEDTGTDLYPDEYVTEADFA